MFYLSVLYWSTGLKTTIYFLVKELVLELKNREQIYPSTTKEKLLLNHINVLSFTILFVNIHHLNTGIGELEIET